MTFFLNKMIQMTTVRLDEGFFLTMKCFFKYPYDTYKYLRLCLLH